MSDTQRFLDAVDAELPLVGPDRADVIDELADHLVASTRGLEESGVAPAEAERLATSRMGDPASLAGEIARARTSRRVLAPAVGHGSLMAARAVVLGWVFGGLVAGVVGGLVVAVFVVASGFTIGPWAAIDGLGVIIQVVMPAFFAYLVGRAVPFQLARRAHRSLRWGRTLTGVVGVPLTLGLVLFTGWGDVNAWTVAGQLVAPFALMAGIAGSPDAAWPIVLDRDLRALAVVTAVLSIAAVMAQPAWMTVERGLESRGHTDLGPAGQLGRLELTEDVSLWVRPPMNGVPVTLALVGELPPMYQEPRVELWAAERDGLRLVPGASEPLRVIGLEAQHPSESARYQTAVPAPRLQDLPPTWSVLVADDASGERVVLDYRANGREFMYRGPGIGYLLGV